LRAQVAANTCAGLCPHLCEGVVAPLDALAEGVRRLLALVARNPGRDRDEQRVRVLRDVAQEEGIGGGALVGRVDLHR